MTHPANSFSVTSRELTLVRPLREAIGSAPGGRVIFRFDVRPIPAPDRGSGCVVVDVVRRFAMVATRVGFLGRGAPRYGRLPEWILPASKTAAGNSLRPLTRRDPLPEMTTKQHRRASGGLLPQLRALLRLPVGVHGDLRALAARLQDPARDRMWPPRCKATTRLPLRSTRCLHRARLRETHRAPTRRRPPQAVLHRYAAAHQRPGPLTPARYSLPSVNMTRSSRFRCERPRCSWRSCGCRGDFAGGDDR